MNDYRLLWAKSDPYRSLIDHLTDAGDCAFDLLTRGALNDVARKLSDFTGLSLDEVASLIGYLASLHDIGKAHPYFQAVDTSLPGIKVLIQKGLINQSKHPVFRHEEYTSEILAKILPESIDADEELIKAITRAIKLHHQGKAKSESTLIPKSSKPEEWQRIHSEINDILVKRYNPPKQHINGDSDAVVYLIMGIVILADWISSDIIKDKVIHDAIKSRGLDSDDSCFSFADFCSLWKFIPKDGMRGVQKAAEELGKDPAKLYIIEAPMGEGKSEAALYLSACQIANYDADGFYMALPTSATGNQMYNRVNALFEQHSIKKSRLIHGTAWMIDENVGTRCKETEPEAVEWLAPLRRAMLSRFAVGTIDQAMLSVMKVKYGVLRLLGLANKVLILDEIHAYDTYMQTIIERLLNWCSALNIPVIMLSATLPKNKKHSLLKAYGAILDGESSMAYPLITSVGRDGAVNETPIERIHMIRCYSVDCNPCMNDAMETAKLAITMVGAGGCVCVLVNTVNRAQQVYNCLKEIESDAELDLFHARFTVERRNQIEGTVVKKYGKKYENRPKKSILVATQVMEQSIDADFDAMITDLAPMDLLLQRIGRVHRFDDTERPDALRVPRITILTSKAGYDDTTVYPGILMQRTEDLLHTLDRIETPAMIRGLVENVYNSESDDEKHRFEMWAKNRFNDQLEAAAAEGVVLPPPQTDFPSFADEDPDFFRSDSENDNYSAKTRIGDGSRRIVLVPKDKIGSLPEKPNINEAKTLMLMSASVRTARFGDPPEGAKVGKGLLAGVVFLPVDEYGFAHWGGYRIQNDNECGIIIEKE